MSTFTQYQQDVAQFKGDILGHVCFYSIPEETVDYDIVAALCKQHDVEKYTPSAPRPPDVFRRACKDAGTRIGRKDDPQRFEYEIKILDYDHKETRAKLVRTTVDADSNQGIDWARQANISFKRDTFVIDVVDLPDQDDIGRECIRNLKQIFAAENGKVNSAHIRRMINAVFRDSLAVSIRPSGGFYFVSDENSDTVAKIKEVLDGLPTGASLHMMPLPDLSDQRNMLFNAVESELAGDIDKVLTEVTELLKKGENITVDKFTKLTLDLQYHGGKGQDYAGLLNSSLTTFESRKVVAKEALGKLADLVDYES